MQKYQLLPHTADVRLKVQATTLPELFQAALEGMNRLLKKTSSPKNNGTSLPQTISLHSPDPTTLLVDFLSEILTLSQLHSTIFSELTFLKFQENSLTAQVKGQKVTTFDEDLKAVSYQEADVQKNAKGLWETVLVFDI